MDRIPKPYPDKNTMGHYNDVFDTLNINCNIDDFLAHVIPPEVVKHYIHHLWWLNIVRAKDKS